MASAMRCTGVGGAVSRSDTMPTQRFMALPLPGDAVLPGRSTHSHMASVACPGACVQAGSLPPVPLSFLLPRLPGPGDHGGTGWPAYAAERRFGESSPDTESSVSLAGSGRIDASCILVYGLTPQAK
ncbi:hypothetical protein ADK87_12415 [Streptomyces sp. NRRL F-4711]|nr:hypothetical protein ADK87_12415 [Streptomyces sp. NRRL F-4711]